MEDKLIEGKRFEPRYGDEVIAVIHHYEQPVEILTARYLSCVQMGAYTTPFYVFLIDGTIRMVNSNAVREFRFEPFDDDSQEVVTYRDRLKDEGMPWTYGYYSDSFDDHEEELDF